MSESPVLFTILTNNISSNPSPHMVVPFLMVPIHWQEIFQERERKRVQIATKKSRHKEKHKIGYYPKFLLILTAYQLQGWSNMVINLLKTQPYGRNLS